MTIMELGDTLIPVCNYMKFYVISMILSMKKNNTHILKVIKTSISSKTNQQ